MTPAVFTLEAGRGRLQLHLVATALGRDWLVALGGGTAHIGAVALSQARPSLKADGQTSATTSVLALLGHKEDDLARAVAGRLSASLEATVCVACGIHLDDIRPEELEQVPGLVDELVLALLQKLKGT